MRDAARPGGSEAVAENIQRSLEAILPFHSRNDDIALLVLAVDESVSPAVDQVEDPTKNS